MRAFIPTAIGALLMTASPPDHPRAASAQVAGEPQDTFYVAPDGNDRDAGTRARPFRTVEHAQAAVRRVNGGMSGDVVVYLRGGTYRLAGTVRFGTDDSGTRGHSVVYRAYPGEQPVLSGGRVVTGWQPDREGCWRARTDLPSFRQLYVNGVRAQRARGGPLAEAEPWGDFEAADGVAGYRTTAADMAGWRNQQDLECGFLNVWSHMVCPVARIEGDGDGGAVVVMAQPCFFICRHKEGVQAGLPDYIENAFELLDEPGEWYLDRAEHMVYYLPRTGEDPAECEFVAPALQTLLEVRGTLDAPVHDLRFEGLTFAEAGWLRPSEQGHADLQANFVILDPGTLFARGGTMAPIHNETVKSPANVVVHAGRSITFGGCRFARLGGAGLDLEHGAQDNLVVGCEFSDISGSGIQVGDVRRDDHHPEDPRLIVKGNRIVNNLIHHIGAEYQDSLGVFCGYADGTLIAHNEIRELPYSGISVGWGWGEEDAGGGNYPLPYLYDTPTPCRDNRIEHNHIHQVLLQRTDGGGIYTLGNQPGTVIRENCIHDNVGAPGGIYLDEGSGFIEVTGNLVYSVNRAMNYNNHAQERIATCDEHDNHFDVPPGDPAFPAEVAARAGLEAEYRGLPAAGTSGGQGVTPGDP